VVIGYGPVGRTLTRLLRENDIVPTVVEMNLETVRSLRDQGQPAVYGDASNAATLAAAGVAQAGAEFVRKNGEKDDIIHAIRSHNDEIPAETTLAHIVQGFWFDGSARGNGRGTRRRRCRWGTPRCRLTRAAAQASYPRSALGVG
jgi:hypothetical protein